MPLSPDTTAALAARLDEARRTARGARMLSPDHPGMTLADAYAVQDALRRLRLGHGEHLSGFKAGMTAPARMRQLGIEQPVFGYLTAQSQVADDATVGIATLAQPRIEAEIGFVMKSALGSADCDADAVLAATTLVVPAIEIIGNRYADFRFDLRDVVADNVSAAHYVAGRTPCPPAGLDLAALEVEIEKNGEVVAHGSGAAVLGHPAAAVAALVRHLAARGEQLPAGSFVLSGATADAIAVQAGDRIVSRVRGLGTVAVRFV